MLFVENRYSHVFLSNSGNRSDDGHAGATNDEKPIKSLLPKWNALAKQNEVGTSRENYGDNHCANEANQ